MTIIRIMIFLVSKLKIYPDEKWSERNVKSASF